VSYQVKEIFYTLQGEGTHAGRPAVFCRFSGCNLWSGREADRSSAVCQFCDTDFIGIEGVGGGSFPSSTELVDSIESYWPTSQSERPFVVCTGGEPLLQLDAVLIAALHSRCFEIAIETNGTIAAPAGIDWICVSPKARTTLRQLTGHELKLVFPQVGLRPKEFESLDFERFYLQPMDGIHVARNTASAIEYCLSNPKWRLSVQTHKALGLR
jgi:7-carboxy-7-deazaguanine synthase (Cx14CxxC type)